MGLDNDEHVDTVCLLSNYNKPKSKNSRQPRCPPEKEKTIMEALKHFGMIWEINLFWNSLKLLAAYTYQKYRPSIVASFYLFALIFENPLTIAST